MRRTLWHEWVGANPYARHAAGAPQSPFPQAVVATPFVPRGYGRSNRERDRRQRNRRRDISLMAFAGCFRNND